MTSEYYYHGVIDILPVKNNKDIVKNDIREIFGHEEGASVSFDTDDSYIVFEGYYTSDYDEFLELLKKADEHLKKRGSGILTKNFSIEVNDGYDKIGEIIANNNEFVFIDIEECGIYNASDKEFWMSLNDAAQITKCFRGFWTLQRTSLILKPKTWSLTI